MKTIIITWNPLRWHWAQYERFKSNELSLPIVERWSCRVRDIRIGDRFFILLQGEFYGIRGIIGSGEVTRDSYMAPHWDLEQAKNGGEMRCIDVRFDKLVNLVNEAPLETDYLKEKYPKQLWTPQGSGISVLSSYVDSIWNEFQAYDGKKFAYRLNEVRKKESTTKKVSASKKINKNDIVELDFDDYL